MLIFSASSQKTSPGSSLPREIVRVFAVLALFAGTAQPALAELDQRGESWVTYSLQTAPPTNTGFVGTLDNQWRWTSDRNQLALRPMVGYQLSPDLTAFLGYQFTEDLRDEGPNREEHRPLQQLTLRRLVTDNLMVSLRWRQEQRFGWEDGVGHRSRLQLRLMWGPNGPTSTVQLVLWHEYFHNLNKVSWLRQSYFDQDRTFVGAVVQTPWNTRFELGYLSIWFNDNKPDQLSHCVSFVATTEI